VVRSGYQDGGFTIGGIFLSGFLHEYGFGQDKIAHIEDGFDEIDV